MTYDQLVDFVERRMRMSHIYQPVMLLTLLQHDGQCSETDIAKAISVHDPTQIEYYEAITRNMVGRVLTKHGVVKRDGKRFSLLSARRSQRTSVLSSDDCWRRSWISTWQSEVNESGSTAS